MELTVADIQRWDPQAVREVCRAATARADAAALASLRLAELPALANWGGAAAEAAWDAFGRIRADLDAHAQDARAVARAAERAALDVETIRARLDVLDDEVSAAGLRIDAENSRVLPGPGFAGAAAAGVGLAEAQRRLDAILAAAETVDAELSAAIGMAGGFVPIPRSGPGAPVGPAGADPGRVNAWWNSLTPGQQAAELDGDPAAIGNLNGIPVTARSEANLRVMRRDLAAVGEIAARAGVSADDVLADPGRYGLNASQVGRYRNAVKTAAGLRRDAGGGGTNPVYLWAYDPLAFGGEGRAAIAIGDPDTAAHTAVIVPGTSSSVEDGWLDDGFSDALHLYGQAALAAPARTAVIAWMGYDAPDGVTDPRIATPWLARAGATVLAADVKGLSASHVGKDGRLTVIGHSYGSTTAADAAVFGMPAEDVVLLGCPGTDLAHSAGDFRLAGGGGVYVGDASTDPVGWLGVSPAAPVVANAALGSPLGAVAGLGTDPAAESFGALRFRAEVPGSDGPDLGDHSHYYTVGSESLRAMTEISTGQSARLTADDLLAEPRRTPALGLPDTIALPGLGTIDLPDVSIPLPGAPEVIDPEWDRPGDTVSDDHGFR